MIRTLFAISSLNTVILCYTYTEMTASGTAAVPAGLYLCGDAA